MTSASRPPPVPLIIRAHYAHGTLEIVIPRAPGGTAMDEATPAALEGAWHDMVISETPIRLRFFRGGGEPSPPSKPGRKRGRSTDTDVMKAENVIPLRRAP